MVDPKIQVGHIGKAIINQHVFKSNYDYNIELAKQELKTEKKFKEWKSKLCQAEIVKKND